MRGNHSRTSSHRLEVVVAADCHVCAEARRLAREMGEQFPDLEVQVIQVDGEQTIPRGVVATPTYLLDSKIISIGNLYREALVRKLALLAPPDG